MFSQSICQKAHKDNLIQSVMPQSVICTKLIIGNVEANPGPMNFIEFLGFLYTDAEEVAVKDVLNVIKATQDRKTNLKLAKSKKVDNLKATLAYLNDWDKDDENIKAEMDNYTKDGIAHLVIKKIYNMAPEKCPACCKTSHFKPGEYCSLTCIRCNRSACIECYDKDKSNLFSTTMFNKTIHFACNECADAIRKENEIEETFKKKACLKKSVKANPTDNPVPADPTDVITEGLQNLIVTDNEVDPEEIVEIDDDEVSKAVDPPKNDSKKDDKPLCNFFKNNICKYGISGKGCKYSHPKMCQKLLKNGTNKRFGCLKGDKCNFFHPKMCHYSLTKKLCLKSNCEFMHTKGTKRSQHENNLPSGRKSSIRLETQHKTKKSNKEGSKRMDRNSSSENQSKSSSFLVQSSQPPKHPVQEAGTGSGEMKLLMNLLQQLIQIQASQLTTRNHNLPQVIPQQNLMHPSSHQAPLLVIQPAGVFQQ